MKTIIATIRYPSDKTDNYELDFPDDATKEDIEDYLKKLTFDWYVRGWEEKKDD